MHWRFTQVALRRHLRRTYDAKLTALLGEGTPTLPALAAAHEGAKRHALASAEGPFPTGPGGPVRTTGRTDRAARGLIDRAAATYSVDVDELRAVRDLENARAAELFLRAPAARPASITPDDVEAQRDRRTA